MKWFKDYAAIDNAKCMKVENGILHLLTTEEPDSVVNFFGNTVKYSTYSTQTVAAISPQYWGVFTENMRYEVRMKCSPEIGFNHALWFMPKIPVTGNKVVHHLLIGPIVEKSIL